MIKDCIHQGDNDCKALRKLKCSGCNFKQTKLQADISKAKSRERLSSLPQTQQSYIADKYYVGEMPWAVE